jgi:hypothetical protein
MQGGLSARCAASCLHSQIDTRRNFGRNTAKKFAECVSEISLMAWSDVEPKAGAGSSSERGRES